MGGTAFVGEAVAMHLIERGYTVDIFTRGIRPVTYDGVREHLKGDRQLVSDVAFQLRNKVYDYVVDISAYQPQDIEPLYQVLDKSQLKRYVFISTGGVYVHSDEIIDENATQVTDLSAGAYCYNKKCCEDLILSYHHQIGFPYTILRPTYIYGEGNNQKREGFYFDKILRGETLQIPYGRNHLVNFIYIDDLVKLIHSAMTSDKALNQAYNATMTQPVTWKQYVVALRLATEQSLEVDYVSYERIQSGEKFYFPFYDEHYELSMLKSIEDGLYQPEIDIEEGLKMSYRWYCENQNRMERYEQTHKD